MPRESLGLPLKVHGSARWEKSVLMEQDFYEEFAVSFLLAFISLVFQVLGSHFSFS
jgi:ABC-type spermidine/putrescine transport system permease subunit II